MGRTSLVDGLIWDDGAAEMRKERRLFGTGAMKSLKAKLPPFVNSTAKETLAQGLNSRPQLRALGGAGVPLRENP